MDDWMTGWMDDNELRREDSPDRDCLTKRI